MEPGRALGRRFSGLLGASAVSGVGDGLVAVAFPLLVATISRDPRVVTGVVVAQRLPWVLLSLHGGALVDRTSLRRLLPSLEVARGMALVMLAALVAAGDLELWIVYLVAFVIGTGDTVVASGLHAAVPAMVPDHLLDKANGRISITQVSGDNFVGPAFGGMLFALAAWAPFAVDGVSFILAALLMFMVLPGRTLQSTVNESLTSDVREGLRWFRSSEPLRLLAMVIGCFALLQAGVFALLVLLATGQLGLTDTQFGLFLTLGAIGNIAGAMMVSRLATHRVALIVVYSGAVAGVCYIAMGATGSVLVAGAAFLVEGIALAVANVVTVSLRQRLIPRQMLGRVGAAFRMCLYGMAPLGALAAGVLANATSVGTAIWVAGLLQLLVVLLAARPLTRVLNESDLCTSGSTRAPGAN